MSKNRVILLIGVILFFIPFLGFTTRWKHFFFIVCGATLVTLSFSESIRRRSMLRRTKRSRKYLVGETFVDGHGSVSSVVQNKKILTTQVIENTTIVEPEVAVETSDSKEFKI